MIHNITDIISTYGYWAMAFGAIIEGETFLIAGGIAAHHGLLHVPGLIALAIVGSLLHDHFFYFLGRYAGGWVQRRFPQFESHAQKARQMLKKYGSWLIVGFRFAYGIRMVVPTVLGMSGIKLRQFFLFDLLGSVLWSIAFVLLGYYFGAGLDAFLTWVGADAHLIIYILIAVIILATLVFTGIKLIYWWVHRPRKRKK